MRRVPLALALLLVLGTATFVKADELREPSFPGGGAGEGDLMTVQATGDVDMSIWKVFMASLFNTLSFYR